MKLLLIVLVMLLTAVPLLAETYSWTDDNGTMNFTEDYSQVPKKYRNKIEIKGSVEAAKSPAVTEGSIKGSVNTVPAVSAKEDVVPKAAVPEITYGGKSMDVWQRELTTAQDALKTLDLKVKNLADQMKNPGENPEGVTKNELIRRYNSAVKEHNLAYDRFGELLDLARKAGVPL